MKKFIILGLLFSFSSTFIQGKGEQCNSSGDCNEPKGEICIGGKCEPSQSKYLMLVPFNLGNLRSFSPLRCEPKCKENQVCLLDKCFEEIETALYRKDKGMDTLGHFCIKDLECNDGEVCDKNSPNASGIAGIGKCSDKKGVLY